MQITFSPLKKKWLSNGLRFVGQNFSGNLEKSIHFFDSWATTRVSIDF